MAERSAIITFHYKESSPPREHEKYSHSLLKFGVSIPRSRGQLSVSKICSVEFLTPAYINYCRRSDALPAPAAPVPRAVSHDFVLNTFDTMIALMPLAIEAVA